MLTATSSDEVCGIERDFRMSSVSFKRAVDLH